MSDPETDVIHTGDAFDVLADLPDNSVHAIVTDPPYGLAFMGRGWDDFEPKEYQEWCEEWASLALDVLKPGGHMLAFSGNRTHHRLFSGVEDAGFEIRDTITWHHGSGFPKALDVSKAIDKAEGAEREVTRVVENGEGYNRTAMGGTPSGGRSKDTLQGNYEKTAPATDAAERWDGFKTQLKPATEYVVVARKPFSGTVAENVQEHGTGALNIGETRVGADVDTTRATNSEEWREGDSNFKYSEDKTTGQETGGRYPANVVFDETAAEGLDHEVGELSAGHHSGQDVQGYKDHLEYDGLGEYTESGGPSRYFYTSKATRAERTLDGKIDNAHPTVKPGDLMEWLVTLVTAENQIVCDPFTGTGTTCRAAKDLNRRFIGIERQAKWADVARVRCGLTPDDPSVVRGDAEQNGLEDFA